MKSSSTSPICCSPQLSAPADDMRTIEDVQHYLRNLEDKTFLELIPVVTFLLVNIVVGVLGNLIVFLVYLKQFKASATRVFVLQMAVCDFLTNVLTMPWNIHDIMYSYTRSVLSCRITWFLGKFPVIVSYMTLICVAFDRRRRICQVHERQLSAGQATYLLILPLTLTSAIVFPFINFYKVIPVETNVSGIRGSTCGFPEYSSKMNVKQILGIALLTIYIVGLVVLTACYLQISYRLYQRKKRFPLAGKIKFAAASRLPKGGQEKQTEENSSKKVETKELSDVSFFVESKDLDVSQNLSKLSAGFEDDADGHDAQEIGSQAETSRYGFSSKIKDDSMRRMSRQLQKFSNPFNLSATACPNANTITSTAASTDNKGQDDDKWMKPGLASEHSQRKKTRSSRMSSDNEDQSHKRVLPRYSLGVQSNQRERALFSRTTFMMLLITISTVICCIPYFALTIANVQLVNVHLISWKKNIYYLFRFFPIVNSVINPFIYSFCNPMFRLQARRLMTKAFTFRRCEIQYS